MMSSRGRILIVALCASLLPASATAAGATLDSARPTVACSAGVCVTHFTVQISGTQNTSWKLPYQRAGAADCLSGDEARGSLASGATFTYCPLMWTGITGVGDLGYLYDGFSEKLPAGDLFNREFGKIILLGHRSFADPSRPYSGITGKTRIQWTVSLTRVAHRRFPIGR